MVLRDIDLDLVFLNDKGIKKAFWEITKTLADIEGVKLLLLANNLDANTEKDRPRSMYIGFKYEYKGNIWKVDMRLLTKKDDVAKKYILSIRNKITQKKKDTILKMKDYYKDDPRYGKEFGGFHIYQAVLNENIFNIEGFEKYIKK
jgi:hypothetical protein